MFRFSGRGYGDPHYITFDGYYQMGFSGNGYYRVLKIEQNHNFTLQSKLDGLVMRSLAFGIQGVESYQVCLPLLLIMLIQHKLSVTMLACSIEHAVHYCNNALLYASLT